MPDGKKLRALALIYSFRMLCPKSELTDENLKLCYILGWCVEMVSFFNIKLLLQPIKAFRCNFN